MNQSLDSRSLFLEEFIKRIIIKSGPLPKKIGKRAVLLEKLEEIAAAPPRLEIEPKSELAKKTEPVIAKKPEQPAVTLTITQKLPFTLVPPRPPARPSVTPKTIEVKTLQMPKPQIPVKPIMPAVPQMPPIQKIPIMDRLNRIFSDPAVQALNCPGPNKNILITKMGRIQASQTSFTEQEIRDFMSELSEKTKIPLIPGLIKVIFQNLIITSVVSEFIGTKFIAERRQQGPLQAPARVQFR